jgi:hypothetical protein
MKEYVNPTCERYCNVYERVIGIVERADDIEKVALLRGCDSNNGEISCDGPLAVFSAVDGAGAQIVTKCRATCETPDIVNLQDVDCASGFEAQIRKVMGEVFEIK